MTYYRIIKVENKKIKSLPVNNIPPFLKGGWGDFPKVGQSKSPSIPLF